MLAGCSLNKFSLQSFRATPLRRKEMTKMSDGNSHQSIQAIMVQPGIKSVMNLEERTMNTNR